MKWESQIKSIRAKEILDSRRNPTIEVELKTASFSVKSSVPSGASKGKYEVVELRDKDGGVKKAIKNVNEIIAPKLLGKDVTRQKEIDDFLIKLDGTKNKSRLGANAILGVSMAVCRTGAKAKKIPLYKHISEIGNWKLEIGNWRMPFPCFNLINGGVHAKGGLNIQEFMVIPQEKSFSQNLKTGIKIYQVLKEILKKNFKIKSLKTGDEGGFVPPLAETKEALDLLMEAIEKIYPVKSLQGKFNRVKIGLDCAATQFFLPPHQKIGSGGEKGKPRTELSSVRGRYHLDGKNFSSKGLLDFYQDLTKNYPILFLEDPFAENDFKGWRRLSSKFQASSFKPIIIGDDLATTNIKRMKMAKGKGLCNGTILKLNQIGTVSEAIAAANLAKKFHWKTIVSHRSGETLDDFIADFSVGVGADFIKSGAPGPKERMTKYQRLVKIEKELCSEKLSFLASR